MMSASISDIGIFLLPNTGIGIGIGTPKLPYSSGASLDLILHVKDFQNLCILPKCQYITYHTAVFISPDVCLSILIQV